MQELKKTRHAAMISLNPVDRFVPGVIAEVDPLEADRLGAFPENAFDEETAWEANADS